MIENEWLFPLRQRIQDLQQQLIVNQQGIMAIDLVIRNNVELMRGVDRATNVTVSALQVAVTLALALANQRVTLDKVLAVNETTDKLLARPRRSYARKESRSIRLRRDKPQYRHAEAGIHRHSCGTR